MLRPELSERAFEEQQISCVVQNLEGVQVVKIDTETGFIKLGRQEPTSSGLLSRDALNSP